MQNMLKGNIVKSLIKFTIPLILGNLFQLTYNAVDSIIIGRFAGDEAMAAVGTADPVMNLLILFITGLCIGSSVMMSNSFGEGNLNLLRKQLSNLLICGLIISLLILSLGIISSKFIFSMMQVPDNILNDALSYMNIIFIGMPFTCIYNIYAAALRSIGDSKTPVKFLAVSCVLNAVLDFIFIVFFNLGVIGAASATVIAELLSAVVCIIYTYKKVDILKIQKDEIKPDKNIIQNMLKLGSTTALQQCSQPLGKLFIQGMVNTLGVSTMAAFNAIGKIEDFALVPERSISSAMMTFTAQNDGAKNKERVKEGLIKGMLLECAYFVFICVFMLLMNKPLLSLFSDKSETLLEGAKYFKIMSFFYILPAFTNGIQGFFRGMKHMKITLILTIIQIAFRVIVTYLLLDVLRIEGIAFACAAGWIAMLIVGGIYYKVKIYPILRNK